MEFKKLYKINSVGGTQVWWMELEGDKYRTHSGKLDGKIVTTAWTVAEPKNIGKANATTSEQQAQAEVESTYTNKHKKGYVDSLEKIHDDFRFQAMLAKDYKDAPRQRDVRQALISGHPVASQRKSDGIRCVSSAKERLMSRHGTELVATPHILEALQPLFAKYPGVVFDGELYSHKYHGDFDSLVSLIRSTVPTDEDFIASAAVVEYHIYDCYFPENPSAAFKERNAFLRECLADINDPRLSYVETIFVTNEQELDVLYMKYLEEGYEGQMIRLHGEYQQGRRSAYLLKRKEFMDAEFTVHDITEGDGNRAGMAGRAHLFLPDGRTFKANIKGNREFLKEVLINKQHYIGGQATVLFGNYTPDGKPRFGRIKTFWPGIRNL